MVGPAELAVAGLCSGELPSSSVRSSSQSTTAAARTFSSASTRGQAGTPELVVCHVPEQRENTVLYRAAPPSSVVLIEVPALG